jgi:hypothetical protein
MNKADFKLSFPEPHSCRKCNYAFKGKVLSLTEKKKTMRFENPGGHPLDAVSVDDCWLQQKTACDFLVLDWKGRPYLVELKGDNIKRALEQLEATLLALIPTRIQDPIPCFLVAREVSIPRAEIQNREKKLRKNWPQASIISKSRQYTHHLVP